MGTFLLYSFFIVLAIQLHGFQTENLSNDSRIVQNAFREFRHLLMKKISMENSTKIFKRSWQIPLKTLALKKKLDYSNMMHFRMLDELTDAFDSFKGKQRQ